MFHLHVFKSRAFPRFGILGNLRLSIYQLSVDKEIDSKYHETFPLSQDFNP